MTAFGKAQPYSGATIFRGLFFGQGPVAKIFTDLPARPARANDRGTDAFVSLIEHKDPQFFGRFGKAMQSGDPVRIDRALRAASDMAKSIAADVKVDAPSHPLTAGAKPSAYSAEIVVDNQINVMDYVDLIVCLVKPPAKYSDLSKGLSRDTWISTIATRLAL